MSARRLASSAIHWADPYSQQKYKTLPSRIDVHSIAIAIVHPSGTAYSVALKSSDSAKLRPVANWAVITRADSAGAANNATAPTARSRFTYVKNYEGLEMFVPKVSSFEYYFGKPTDEIWKVICPDHPDTTRPNLFCTYYTSLGPNFYAQIDLIDFRVNGGLSFAKERIATVKKTVCAFALSEPREVEGGLCR